jgi:hypothetical protein
MMGCVHPAGGDEFKLKMVNVRAAEGQPDDKG